MIVVKKLNLNLLLIIALALGIRLINLNQSLWLDEAINVIYAKSLSLLDYLTKYSIADFHPPGWFAVLWIWGHVFGFSELSVRMPSVAFGVLTIFFNYLIAKKLYNQYVGYLSSLLLIIAPLHIYYSQEARMYSFAAFAVTLMMYWFIIIIKNSANRFTPWLYMFSMMLVLYSDYVAYLIIPAQWVYLCLYKKEKIKSLIVPSTFGLLSILPWMLIFTIQIQTGLKTANTITGWRDVVGGASIKNTSLLLIKIIIGRISFVNKNLYYIVVILAALPYTYALWKVLKNFTGSTKILIYWLCIPIILGILISIFIPIFSYFRFLFIEPAFYILVAQGVYSCTANIRKILITVLILSELMFSGLYLFNPVYHREDWKDAVKFVESKLDNNSIVLFANNEIPAPYIYYSANLTKTKSAFSKIPAKNISDISQDELIYLENIYLFDYLVEITDPNKILAVKLQSLGFQKKEIYNFRGVGFISKFSRIY